MSNEAIQLAEQITDRYFRDEKTIEQSAKRLIELLPSLNTAEIDRVVKEMESIAHDENLLKRQLAGNITEIALIRRPIPDNPLSIGIKQLSEQLTTLNFTGIEFFASIIQTAVLIPLLALFALVWPYGLIPVAAGAIWKVILVSRAKIKFKTRGIMEKMPLTLAIGVYFLLWLPLALLCLPFVIIGWLGTLIE